MDWPCQAPSFYDEQFDVFQYEQGQSSAIRRYTEEGTQEERLLENEDDWEDLLEGDFFCRYRPKSPGIATVLAGRAQDSKNLRHNSAILEYLPFPRTTFNFLTIQMPIHGDISRIINRSDSPIFAEMNLDVSESARIYYFFRTSSAWPGDMGASCTFHRDHGFTTSIVFGCDEEMRESIAARIENSEEASTHPLLILGILAEVERERHLELVRKQVHALLQRVYNLSNQEQISQSSVLGAEHYSVDSWIGVSQLRNGLEGWKEQLQKMITHIANLELDIHQRSSFNKVDLKTNLLLPSKNIWQLSCIRSGRRIAKRLLEIISEYDDKIRECSIVIDGVSLAAQMSWNRIGFQDAQANLKIATDTHEDSGQMRSIALLTMIFLPATFVASLFSTGFFNWDADDGEKVLSPYIWIYPAATVGLTILVFVAWYLSRRVKRQNENMREKSCV